MASKRSNIIDFRVLQVAQWRLVGGPIHLGSFENVRKKITLLKKMINYTVYRVHWTHKSE